MKAQVAVDVLHAVVPVENQVALLDRPQPGHTEVDHRFEVPKKRWSQPMNLLLAGWHMSGIDISLFKVSENKLTWRSIVAVGSEEHVREPQLGCDREKVLRLMVFGTINNDYCVFSPLWPLIVEPSRQVSEEELHHLGV
jgi:hypothetical protein